MTELFQLQKKHETVKKNLNDDGKKKVTFPVTKEAQNDGQLEADSETYIPVTSHKNLNLFHCQSLRRRFLQVG